MFAAFRERRPWAAALITFAFDPIIGMLFLNRWGLSLLYFVGLFLVFFGTVSIWGAYGVISKAWLITFAYSGAGSIHAYLIAQWRPQHEMFRWYSRWYVLAVIWLFFVTAPLTIRYLGYQSFSVPSVSMEPNFGPDDYILVRKAAYDHAAPQRGDVIVFRVPTGGLFTKRIVGIPGDHIQFVDGVVRINGTRAQLLGTGTFKIDCTDVGCTNAHQYTETLPDGHAYRIIHVLDGSPLNDTKAITVPPDSYFVVGDNRDNSRDSRLDDFGYVSRDAIVGRVVIKCFDGATKRWVWEHV